MVNFEITDGLLTINYKISVSCTASDIKKYVEKEIGKKDFTLLLDGQTLEDTQEINVVEDEENLQNKKISLKIVYSHENELKSGIYNTNDKLLSNNNFLTQVTNSKKQNCNFSFCKIKICIKQACKFCEKSFCGKHRIPEEHKCEKFKLWKEEAKNKNASKLNTEKCSRNKI